MTQWTSKEFDYDALQPNIRKTVRWLHANGYETTDSGDGSAHAAGMECASPVPMVAMTTTIDKLVEEGARLWRLVGHLKPREVLVEISYDFAGDSCPIILLLGLDDSMMGELPQVIYHDLRGPLDLVDSREWGRCWRCNCAPVKANETCPGAAP